jgi:predicted metal-dependent HD superfamily phosphohydrolase
MRDQRELRWRFGDLVARLPKRGRPKLHPALMFAFIENAYERRIYHCLGHVVNCLDELSDENLPVELAIWFHDIVYDVRRADNEARSCHQADLFMRDFKVDASLRPEVRRLIMATDHQHAPKTKDEKLIVDIDLSILGKDKKTFDRYDSAIRKEYSHVSEPDYRKGRLLILTKFFERPRIYNTDSFFDKYERAARQNLKSAISKLKK